MSKRTVALVLALLMLLADVIPSVMPGAEAAVSAPASLKPKYGSNGKFIAPVKPPAKDSVAISNLAELRKFRSEVGVKNSKYHLTADIDLSGVEWKPPQMHDGIFDGQGFVIRNLKITKKKGEAGFFEHISNSTVKNLGFEGTKLSANNAGAVSSGNVSGSVIDNCYNAGSISAVVAGGIAVEAVGNSKISNCYNTGSISAVVKKGWPQAAGIVVGTHDNAGNVYSGSAKGIAKIINCYNTGTVSALSKGKIKHTSTNNRGRAAGITLGQFGGGPKVSSCYNAGKILATEAFGISQKAHSIRSCYNTGAIRGADACGIGNAKEISDCFNTGAISASFSNPSVFTASIALGIGGARNMKNCYNTGTVSAYASKGTSASAAGIGEIGITEAFRDCYNTGPVNATSKRYAVAGGISAGGSSMNGKAAELSSCYNAGKVRARAKTSYAGGIMGWNGMVKIKNCYWSKKSAKKGVGYYYENYKPKKGGAKPLNARKMKKKSSYKGFDFKKAWVLTKGKNKGFPVLRAFNKK
ncbi:MAG: hypothetical protein FWH04_03570 [Oscillospiraceae bacterium]|nr:hypothetical protein [Oscillospiraceae bacterium]